MNDNLSPAFNRMQSAKRMMFAMRNGVIADALRKSGSAFKIIFGLNLPQMVDIAASLGKDRKLADDLWHNTSTRESMLIAPMLVDPACFTIDEARQWAGEVPDTEVADILCHRLLRHTPYALELAREMAASPDGTLAKYTGMRLMCNLAFSHVDEAVALGRREASSSDRRIAAIARQLLDFEAI